MARGSKKKDRLKTLNSSSTPVRGKAKAPKLTRKQKIENTANFHKKRAQAASDGISKHIMSGTGSEAEIGALSKKNTRSKVAAERARRKSDRLSGSKTPRSRPTSQSSTSKKIGTTSYKKNTNGRVKKVKGVGQNKAVPKPGKGVSWTKGSLVDQMAKKEKQDAKREHVLSQVDKQRSTAHGAAKGKTKGHSFTTKSKAASATMPTGKRSTQIWHRPNGERIAIKGLKGQAGKDLRQVRATVDKKVKPHIKLNVKAIEKNTGPDKDTGPHLDLNTRRIRLNKKGKGTNSGGRAVSNRVVAAHEIGHAIEDSHYRKNEGRVRKYQKVAGKVNAPTKTMHKEVQSEIRDSLLPGERKKYGRSDYNARKMAPGRRSKLPVGQISKRRELDSLSEHFAERFRSNLGYKTPKDHPTHHVSRNPKADSYMRKKVLSKPTSAGPRPGSHTSTMSLSKLRPTPGGARKAATHVRPRSSQVRSASMRVHMTKITSASAGHTTMRVRARH